MLTSLHARWAADSGLSALLPAARLFTGLAAGSPAAPYAVLHRRRTVPETQTSAGVTIARSRIEVELWGDDLDVLEEIAGEVQRVFDGSSFPLAVGNVLAMRSADRSQSVADDATWRLTLQYDVLTQQPTGK